MITELMKSARFVSRKKITRDSEEFTFAFDQSFSYVPGQYVWIDVPGISPERGGGRRAFSIAGSPSEKEISIYTRFTQSDFKKALFSLQPGTSLTIVGPLGSNFTLDLSNRNPKQITMVAGGTCVSGFLNVLNEAATKQLPIDFHLVYLNTDKDNVGYLDYIKELAKKNKRFTYDVCFEYFSKKMVSRHVKGTDDWWICGPQPMVDLVHKELREVGVGDDKMYFENRYPTPKYNLKPENLIPQTNNALHSDIYRQALENSTNHIIITDINGYVMFANKAAQQITGYAFEEMIGNTPRLWGGFLSHDVYKQFWIARKAGQYFTGEIKNRRKNGEIYYAIAHISPIFDLEHNVIGFIATEEDITDFRRIQDELKLSTDRFMLAVDAMTAGVWDWEIEKNVHWWSPRFYQLLGYTSGEIAADLETYKSFIHPDDLKNVLTHFERHMTERAPFSTEFRMKTKDGTYKWFLGGGSAQFDAGGKALRMVGTITDIDASKRAVAAMQESKEELERFNKLMIGRELRIADLKERVAELELSLGKNETPAIFSVDTD